MEERDAAHTVTYIPIYNYLSENLTRRYLCNTNIKVLPPSYNFSEVKITFQDHTKKQELFQSFRHLAMTALILASKQKRDKKKKG